MKSDPAQIRIFEIYADAAAYEAHLQTPHFKKYKTGTQGMVKSLVLVEAIGSCLALRDSESEINTGCGESGSSSPGRNSRQQRMKKRRELEAMG